MDENLPLYNLENGVQLFQNYQTKSGSKMFNLENYWMSEKYDGVRAIYLGNNRLVTTRGDLIKAPSYFFKQFPENIPLDGELWLGYGRFNDISGLVRSRTTRGEEWKYVKYMVFDLPVAKDSLPIKGVNYNDLKFEIRQKILQEHITENSYSDNNIHLVKQEKIATTQQFNLFYHHVIDAKGEGVIIMPPDSLYQGGKRFGYKQKPVDDSEAVVVGYKEGNGKNVGITGSLIVKGVDSNGKIIPSQEYSIGTGLTQYQRTNATLLYPVGTVVVCQYNGLSSRGIPRFPRLKGVRADITINLKI